MLLRRVTRRLFSATGVKQEVVPEYLPSSKASKPSDSAASREFNVFVYKSSHVIPSTVWLTQPSL